jgi:hypothetical protein
MIAAAEKIDPLDLLYVRCCTMAERVAAGEVPFIEAVDFMWEAAAFAGIVDRVGPDQVQAVLAAAFMGVPKGASCTTC